MKLKNPLWMFMALMMASTLPALAKEKEKNEVIKIVYQCDFSDVQRVHLMLNTLNNLVKHYQSTLTEYEINVVALGPCLQFVMKDFAGTGFEKKPYLDHGGPIDNGTTGRIKSLLMTTGDNLKIIGCENTMKEKTVKAEQMEDFVELTPAGIVKIIDLEREGYAYIKIM